MSVVGLLLAGGESRRMGGNDKGQQPWRDRPMAEWVAGALTAVVPELIVSANQASDFYCRLSPHVVADSLQFRHQGPLAGLLAGLRYAEQLGYRTVLVCPSDTPAISPALLRSLLAAYEAGDGRPVIADCGGRVHPLHGVYPVELGAQLARQLQAGNRRVYQFALAAGAKLVACGDHAADFVNCNRPEDLR